MPDNNFYQNDSEQTRVHSTQQPNPIGSPNAPVSKKGFKNWSKKKKVIFFAIIAVIAVAIIAPIAGGNSGSGDDGGTTTVLELGSVGTIRDVKYSLNDDFPNTRKVHEVSSYFGQYEPGNNYIIVYVNVQNDSNSETTVYASDFKLKYLGATYETDSDSSLGLASNFNYNTVPLTVYENVGAKMKRTFCFSFQVPDTAELNDMLLIVDNKLTFNVV